MNADEKLRRYERDIVAKAKSTTIPGYDHQDIAQELMIALWQKLPKHDPKKSSEATFAQLVMRSKLIDLWRKATSQKRILSNFHQSLESLVEQGVQQFTPILTNTPLWQIQT